MGLLGKGWQVCSVAKCNKNMNNMIAIIKVVQKTICVHSV